MTGHVTILDATWADRSAADGSDGGPTADFVLAVRAIRGEPGAFGQLYQQHVDGVYHYVRFRVRDDALAEDLTHDVFVSALRHIGELKAPERFRAWLLTIAHNRVLNHWRDAAIRPLPAARLPEDSPEEAGPTVAVEDEGFDAVASKLDAARVLVAAEQLTALQQQVVALRFVAGLSLAETAESMDRSVNAVKNLQHHALAALRQHLGYPTGVP
jgi:RNA polymerase sigma-70 factor (ECF subfamily)